MKLDFEPNTLTGILKADCRKNGETYKSKLIFEMDDTVWWIDFSFQDLKVERIFNEFYTLEFIQLGELRNLM